MAARPSNGDTTPTNFTDVDDVLPKSVPTAGESLPTIGAGCSVLGQEDDEGTMVVNESC